MEIANGKAVQIAVLETQLKAILESLARIEQKQDADTQMLSSWKILIETRLATGSHKFDALERFDKATLAIAGAIGMLILGLLWAILVGQVDLVFP